jgi:FkbH-like protein
VVFVDDNPLELDEIKLAHPGITCLRFFPKDPAKVWELLGTLRDLFGKPAVLEEDRLRGASIRATSQFRQAGEHTGSIEFLQGLQGVVTIDCRNDPADMRALELINKTNQFNLNGLRVSEGEWKRYLESPGSLSITVSYQDKFGPLGKIAVVLGQQVEKRVIVSHWVMSCRAFSRQIEHHTLRALFQHSNADEIQLAFQPTPRNQPLQEFVRLMGVHSNGSGNPLLTLSGLQPQIGRLPHQESYLKP